MPQTSPMTWKYINILIMTMIMTMKNVLKKKNKMEKSKKLSIKKW